MILNCVIIDDEPLAADLLASYARKIPDLNLIGVYDSAVKAMTVIRNNPVDLLFLDIQMPELSGLEFASILPKETKVVFTTAFDQYAIEGYKVNALDYLLKPVSFDRFVMSVNKVMEWFKTMNKQKLLSEDKFIYIKSEYKLVKVRLDEILYVEGLKDYIKIYLSEGRKPIMSLMNMKTLEDTLPHPAFLRVHRSFIVNMSKADMIDRGRIVIDGSFIPVSESYKEHFQDYIDSHTVL